MGKHTDLTLVQQPIKDARGLPNEHYIDEQIFKEEEHAILQQSWTALGFGHDVPNNGDAKPVEFLGLPLLLLRDHEGQIGVYQNTCRHRGMILLTEPKNLRNTIRCPYHSWCYSLKGELVATPNVGGPGQNTHEDLDNATLGLFKIRTHVWHDVVFVNISGDAPEFNAVHADLLERWKEFEQPMFHGGASSSFNIEVNSNWKLAVENYCESYHLPSIHPELNRYSRLEDHYDIDQDGAYSGQGTHVYQQLKGEENLTFNDFSELSDKWDTAAEYIALYPNVLLGVHRDHFFSMILEPMNSGKTTEKVSLYYASDVANEPKYNQMIETNAGLWKTIFEEDISVVEGMQQGRRGVFFDGGKFSPAMDRPTHTFHRWVAGKLEQSRANNANT